MANRFVASFPGECSECAERFDEGDRIGYVEDELCCDDCCADAEDEEDGLMEGWGGNVKRIDT